MAGLLLAKKGCFNKLHIEGDSLVIIDACIHRRIISWKLKYVLNQIWRLLDECSDVCLLHIYREGNKVEDLLSNLGCDGVTVSTFHSLPFIEQHKALKNIIQEDMKAANSSNILCDLVILRCQVNILQVPSYLGYRCRVSQYYPLGAELIRNFYCVDLRRQYLSSFPEVLSE